VLDGDYDEMLAAAVEFARYLQAGGTADALTIEIREPGGRQWGCRWMRYVVGHRAEGGGVLDVEIPMPGGASHESATEVFDAEEAADPFQSFHRCGDSQERSALGTIEGCRADGSAVEIA
jgi:hypothetical protein